MDDETLGKLLAEVHREYADYRRPEGVCVSPSSMSVMVDRTGKPVECEDNRVMNVHDRTGKLVEASSHKVQEVGSLEHRDDVDKFNLAIDEKNIDFNISGVPNAMVKRSHSINVHNLITKSTITLNDKHFKMIFNNIEHSIPSVKSQKMRLWLLGTLNHAR